MTDGLVGLDVAEERIDLDERWPSGLLRGNGWQDSFEVRPMRLAAQNTFWCSAAVRSIDPST